ncbi:MAG: hypothetical protein M3323_15855 [Actinomycetota bacterium]|nr:hypothetical protein [Actinomycetota bacterium]
MSEPERGHPVSIYCPSCRLEQPVAHSFCVRCGTTLPVDLLERDPAKSARFFAGVRVDGDDPENAFLRVTSYHHRQVIEAPEGSVEIAGDHVRFSVWVEDRARCVISIPESEARELVTFLAGELRARQTV